MHRAMALSLPSLLEHVPAEVAHPPVNTPRLHDAIEDCHFGREIAKQQPAAVNRSVDRHHDVFDGEVVLDAEIRRAGLQKIVGVQ